ncbi:tRNA uridine-5-carboxymethylaminomethyl(34) synthesis GTPase MnmE [Stakelama marina]|uniref:tRNA uridine-5-carboxymethylaminomethyl(34) synthesis GTPase MnmE n=1 Tax=Stakelama marina TaxID=2826939 RepID=UPI003D36F1B0
MDTIFALSSGLPPAGIGVIRVSGAAAGDALLALTGRDSLPTQRKAVLRRIVDPRDGAVLDDALLLWFQGPATATGEDLAEIHCHGGRAVIRAVEGALAAVSGLRAAEPGEFTRRALINGRIDLTQAEALGDLLTAETETARRIALANSGGALRRQIDDWGGTIVDLSSRVEAVLDHADEDDIDEDSILDVLRQQCRALAGAIARALRNPPVERLNEGINVVLAGPPNAGKSTLLNRLVEREAAIVSPIAGTTRDRVDAAVRRHGVGYVFTDTAGLAERTDDPVEAIGIERARVAAQTADILLWLGDDAPPHVDGLTRIIPVHPRSDEAARADAVEGRIRVSAHTGEGIEDLWALIESESRDLIPRPDQAAMNQRQRDLCAACVSALDDAAVERDPILLAESLRAARASIDRITGRADVEAMLDSLFSRFCIGK